MQTYRAPTPPCPHAMLSAESIIFLFDRLKHKGWRVHWLLNGRELPVLLEVDAAVSAEQDVFSTTVVPVLGGCCWKSDGGGSETYNILDTEHRYPPFPAMQRKRLWKPLPCSRLAYVSMNIFHARLQTISLFKQATAALKMRARETAAAFGDYELGSY